MVSRYDGKESCWNDRHLREDHHPSVPVHQRHLYYQTPPLSITTRRPGCHRTDRRESLLPQGKVQPRSSVQQGTVGFWTRRHISKTSHHLYADSGQTWCWHSSTNYTKCGITGDHHTLRPMESILPYPWKTSSRACNSKPFCQLCWSGDRCPHTDHRILLGTNQANNVCSHIAEQYPV